MLMALPVRVSASPIRVLIADGHTLFRDGLRKLLETEDGFQVVGDVAEGDMVVALARQAQADIILLSLTMPRLDGMEILRELSAAELPARTLLLAEGTDRKQIVNALKLGAYGIVTKDSTTQRLFDSIRCVMAGQYWIGRESVSDLVRALRAFSPVEGLPRFREFGLTPRELEIVTQVVAGYSNPEIAERCSISEQTVKHHMSNIFDKIGVSNRLELALFAVNHRLTEVAS
jgi:two-component system, NarL family, nitrate/nitrite response regulator NarL